MKRVLVTGAGGMLGRAACAAFEGTGWEVVALRHVDFDVTDPVSSGRIVAEEWGNPDLLVNAAAYTAVDRAESEPDLAYDLNTLAPGFLARACAMSGITMIHISTDYVFDGEGQVPYRETDEVAPLGVYGQTKREGEVAVLAHSPMAYVLRTSWLFAPQAKNFARTILSRLELGQPLRVVNDQFGTPTYVPFLADSIFLLAEKKPMPGVYHAAGPDVVSWFEFAEAIRTAFGPEFESQPIEPVGTEAFPTIAKRPRYSALDSSPLAKEIGPMPNLNQALKHFATNVDRSTGV